MICYLLHSEFFKKGNLYFHHFFTNSQLLLIHIANSKPCLLYTSLCTTHYIRKSVLKELVLADLQRVLSYVQTHEQAFIQTANECSEQAMKKTMAQQHKELDKAQGRMSELNVLFRKLYEDNALGKLSDEQFAFLTSGYDEEKKTLTRRIAELTQELDTAAERSADVKRFVTLVRKYTAIEELTYENVHEFIDRILIHELDKETNTRKIEIFYSFVGRVDTCLLYTSRCV